MGLEQYTTNNYEVTVLEDEDKAALYSLGYNIAVHEGTIPNVYGVRNTKTGCFEFYCCHLSQAVHVIANLEQSLSEACEKLPKKSHLTSV